MTIAGQFIVDSARAGRAHPLYAGGMHSLLEELEKIVTVLNEAKIAYEGVDGIAVNAHLLPRHRSRSFVWPNIDLMIRREDLEGVVEAGRAAGYEGRRIIGGYLLIRPGQHPAEAIHLIFAGERSKSTQPSPHPEVQPEMKSLFGVLVPVAPLSDLLRMMLNSFRPKDLVHLEILDETGLITAEMEATLPAALQDRLTMARQQFAANEPDFE
jgi:hypothetical protein